MTPDGQAVCAQLRAEMIRTGWCEMGRRTGFDRTSLMRAFKGSTPRNFPHFTTVCCVAEALGLKVVLVPASPAENPTSEAE